MLPAASPGILTGTILAMSRAIGEAAPIVVISGLVYLTFVPANPLDRFTALPLQIFNWASRPQEDFPGAGRRGHHCSAGRPAVNECGVHRAPQSVPDQVGGVTWTEETWC